MRWLTLKSVRKIVVYPFHIWNPIFLNKEKCKCGLRIYKAIVWGKCSDVESTVHLFQMSWDKNKEHTHHHIAKYTYWQIHTKGVEKKYFYSMSTCLHCAAKKIIVFTPLLDNNIHSEIRQEVSRVPSWAIFKLLKLEHQSELPAWHPTS